MTYATLKLLIDMFTLFYRETITVNAQSVQWPSTNYMVRTHAL